MDWGLGWRSRTVPGSISGVHWIFQWRISFRPHRGPRDDSAPSEDEYQEHSWRQRRPVRDGDDLTTFKYSTGNGTRNLPTCRSVPQPTKNVY